MNMNEDEYFDFKRIFTQIKTPKKQAENLNIEYPNEIDKILQIKDTNYLLEKQDQISPNKGGFSGQPSTGNSIRAGHPALAKHPFH